MTQKLFFSLWYPLLARTLVHISIRPKLSVLALIVVALVGTSPSYAQNADDQEGVKVEKASRVRKLVPAKKLEEAAGQEYQKMLDEAAGKNALLPDMHPEVKRLRAIAQRIIPFTQRWHYRALEWQWQINVIAAEDVNAFCMPGGKIVFYTGILDTLKLTDDEVAMVMGHEIAHALREHARERIAKTQLTGLGANILSQALGLGDTAQKAVGIGANLWALKFSRSDETDADLVGLDVAARAGYDPRAAIAVWQKMEMNTKGAPPQWLSTHPAGETRIKDIQNKMNQALPLYARAIKKPVEKLPPYKSNVALPAI